MLGKKQWAAFFITIILIVPIYLLDIEVLVNNNISDTTNAVKDVDASFNPTQVVEKLTRIATSSLSDNGLTEIEELTEHYQDNKDIHIAADIAEWWYKKKNYGLSGAWWLQVALQNNDIDAWEKALEYSNIAHRFSADEETASDYVAVALQASAYLYNTNPKNITYKSGRGIALVNGGQQPMEGIQLLKECLEQDPFHFNSNFNLALFSMKTGQFEKALERLNNIEKEKRNMEVYFYLALVHKELGNKDSALNMFQQCKAMITDPSVSQSIDKMIKELQHKH